MFLRFDAVPSRFDEWLKGGKKGKLLMGSGVDLDLVQFKSCLKSIFDKQNRIDLMSDYRG